MQTVATSHIHLDERGVAWIDDTNTKVIEVVLDKIAYGLSPEEMHSEHPHLSLAQIHGALTYYYENLSQFDARIRSRLREADQLAVQASAGSDFRHKLIELKRSH